MPRRESPLAPGDGALVAFARELRRLRERAGSPTYRALSAQAHYSAAALSEAASARKLPTLALTLAYVTACDGDVALWEARWHATAAELAGAGTEPERRDDAAPYAGLAAFQMDDADRFFGRERLVDELSTKLRSSRFLGVFGPSGCGKSSILRAGLGARLAAERHRVLVFTPGSQPTSFHRRIRQALADQPGEGDVVLIVDQFEEIFTLCGDEDERAWLINALVTAASAKRGRTRVVLGVRADFYGHCARHPLLVAALRDAQVMVGPMTPDELRTAITEPAAQVGCRVETALVARLVAEATGQPGILPLVSHVLLETWTRRRGATLALSGYDAAGGLRHALARSADQAYGSLDADQRDIARRVFLRLTAPGEGTEDTKRRVPRHEWGDDPETTAVLERLAHGRLITLDRDGAELAHEALIRHWPQLRDWLGEDREGQRIHRRLTEAADAWEAVERDPGALYRGTRLALAKDWSGPRGADLSARERAFLHASLAAEAGEQDAARHRTSRLRRLVALLAVLLVLTTAAMVYAVRAEQTATAQRNAAVAQRVIREVDGLVATNRGLAAQLVLAAYRIDANPDTRGSMLGVYASTYDRLHGHGGRIAAVSFSPNGSTLVSASADHTVRLWPITDNPYADRQSTVLTGHTDALTAAAFSPEGHLLATASLDGTVRLWDVTGRALGQLDGHTGGVVAIAFGSDGNTLATSGLDHQVRLWDITDPAGPRSLAVLAGLANPAFALAFNGSMLAVGSYHDVRRYDLSTRDRPRELAIAVGEKGVVTSIAFTPDGRTMATAGNDDSARLWDVSDREHPSVVARLDGHSAIVATAVFSPDGRTLATAANDGTLRLWEVADRRHPTAYATVTGPFGTVSGIAFRPDGHTVAAAGDDATITLLETDPERIARTFCAGGYPWLTLDEWQRHFPGLDYRTSC